jgi:hypothetical protein
LVAAIAKPSLLFCRRSVRHALVAFGSLAVCMPSSVMGAVTSQRGAVATGTAALQGAVVDDVALAGGGRLEGLLLDPRRVPQSGVCVVLRRSGRQVGRFVTGRAGEFVMTGLRGGLYQLVTPRYSRLVRLWTPGTAPPSARQAAVLVVPHTVVRGQSPRPKRFSSDALLLGTIVTAGATIPWIINGSRSNDSSGS